MQALKAWKKQHNEVTWSKKKASLAVLRQKEKEDEQVQSFRSRTVICAMKS